MTLTLQPVRVATGAEEEGLLVFDQERRLVAMLVRLSDDNEVTSGKWSLEAAFGRIDGTSRSITTSLRIGSVSTSLIINNLDGESLPEMRLIRRD